jgi:hypothetical protein
MKDVTARIWDDIISGEPRIIRPGRDASGPDFTIATGKRGHGADLLEPLTGLSVALRRDVEDVPARLYIWPAGHRGALTIGVEVIDGEQVELTIATNTGHTRTLRMKHNSGKLDA